VYEVPAVKLPGAIPFAGRRVLLKYHQLLSGSGAHPPNSLSALREVLAGGAEVIEFDVHAIADGGYLLLHDDTLDRETTGTGKVARSTTASLSALRLRGSDETPALLADVVPLLAAHRRPLKVQVDLKDAFPLSAEQAGGFLRAIAPLSANTHLSVVVGCQGDWNLRTLRRLDPSLAVGLDILLYLDVPSPEFPRLPLRVNVYGYLDDHPLGFAPTLPASDYLVDRLESVCTLVPGVREVYLRAEFIRKAIADGVNPIEVVRRQLGAAIVVDAWTLNADHPRAAEMLHSLLRAGVDQITTDTAPQLAALLPH
jgi:glycerophosphoryl diester phosphodiesterase